MVTRFFLPSTGTAPESPAFSSDWDITSGAVRRPMGAVGRGSADASLTYSDSNDTDQDILLAQYVSEPLRAVTIGAQSITFAIKAIETSTDNNLFTVMSLRLVDFDGNDYGSPKVLFAHTLDNTELPITTAVSRSLSGTTTSQDAAEGDRLVFEFGLSGNPADGTGSHSATLTVGDSYVGNLVGDGDTGVENPTLVLGTTTLVFWGQRWYLPSTGTTNVTPSFHAGWEVTSSAVRRPLLGLPDGSAMTDFTITDSNDTDQDHLLVQYISPPLQAQTIGNWTNRFSCRASEVLATNNMFTASVWRIVQNDGTDYSPVRYVFHSGSSVARDGTEVVATTLTARSHALGVGTTVSVGQGDRLVVEVGLGGDPGAGSDHDSRLSLGADSATDLTLDSNLETTANNPWIQISTTVEGLYVANYADVNEYQESPDATCTGTATVTRTLTLAEAPSATCTGTAVVTRRLELNKAVAATCTGTAVVAKSLIISQAVSATCTGTATNTVVLTYDQPISATCTGTATATREFTTGRVGAATCIGTATVARRLTLSDFDINAEGFGFAAVTRHLTIAKAISATCTGTVNVDDLRGRNIPVLFGDLTCTGTATVSRTARLQGHVSNTPGRVIVLFDV